MLRAHCPTELDEAKVLASIAAHPLRDQCLWVLGAETGLRLTELCGLRVGAVWRAGHCVSILRVSRRHLKGGRGPRARSVRSREIPLNDRAQEFISLYLQARESEGALHPLTPLFVSRKQGQPITRGQGWRIIRGIFLDAGLDPQKTWSGHSLRRRFLRRIFDVSDLETARLSISHVSTATTILYLSVGQDNANEAVLKIGRVNRPAGDAEQVLKGGTLSPLGAATAGAALSA